MAIDIDAEDLQLLRETGKWCPKRANQDPPSFPTANRWAVNGLLRNGTRIRLETVMIGGRRYTSTEAARRFIAALNADPQQPASTTVQAEETAANGREAKKALSGMGVI